MNGKTWTTLTLFVITLVLVGCVAMQGKEDPPAYTQSIVQDAIRLYESNGRQAIIDRYRSRDSIDGQWYVFVLDEEKKAAGPLQT